MKKIILSLLFSILIVGCNKQTTQPTPVVQQQQQQPNSLSAQEQQLVGNWIMDSAITYSNTIRQYGSVYSTPSTCRINFYSTALQSDPNSKNCDAGHLACALSAVTWKAPNIGYVTISNVMYSIDTVNASKLVLESGGGAGTMKYFFHK